MEQNDKRRSYGLRLPEQGLSATQVDSLIESLDHSTAPPASRTTAVQTEPAKSMIENGVRASASSRRPSFFSRFLRSASGRSTPKSDEATEKASTTVRSDMAQRSSPVKDVRGDSKTSMQLEPARAVERHVLMYNLIDPALEPQEYVSALGADTDAGASLRMQFFNLFDFRGVDILTALRQLCSKLYIKGETQVIDRVLEAFARRWHACNPDTGLRPDEVYILTFALITLNTDVHIANLDIERQMKRAQFLQNVFAALAALDANVVPAPAASPSLQGLRIVARSAGDISMDARPDIGRLHGEAQAARPLSTLNIERGRNFASSRVTHSSADLGRDEATLGGLLQEFYSSIRRERIRQPMPDAIGRRESSETGSGSTSLESPHRLQHSSSRSSLWSQTGSARPAAMMLSLPSPCSAAMGTRHSQTAATGFAGSLSHAIIEEEDADDRLALSGPPFAKEGMLTIKVVRVPGETRRRGTKVSSTQAFGVCSGKTLRLYNLTKSHRRQSMNGGSSAAPIGGGDWYEAVQPMAELPLPFAIARSVSSSKDVAHSSAWQLELADGLASEFLAGTPDLAREWLSTVNFWAARASPEPLLGAVSSTEYGWGLCSRMRDAPNGVFLGDDCRVHEWISQDTSALYSEFVDQRVSSSLTEQLDRVSRYLVKLQDELNGLDDARRRLPTCFSGLADHGASDKIGPTSLLKLTSAQRNAYQTATRNFERRRSHLLRQRDRFLTYVAALKEGVGRRSRLLQESREGGGS
ncbi:hypothetical protein PYCC9005_003308 [Savitreella phatthalungensis]